MSYEFYKIVHIVGIVATFVALGGATVHAANGGDKKSNTMRVIGSVTHGAGLLIVLVAGFGLIAKLGTGFPLWVWLKLVIWLVLGALGAVIPKVPSAARIMWFALPLLAAAAAWLAVAKPFV